jgi:ADP-heptose:LPS heptosyltransferase
LDDFDLQRNERSNNRMDVASRRRNQVPSPWVRFSANVSQNLRVRSGRPDLPGKYFGRFSLQFFNVMSQQINMLQRAAARIQVSWTWRINAEDGLLFRRIVRPLAENSGFWSRRIRHPIPWITPAKQDVLRVGRRAGLGDILMCTPALREVKRLNPHCHIIFHANHVDLIRGLPFIDEVISSDATEPAGTIQLTYENIHPVHRHLSEVVGDHLGVKVTDVRPSCVFRQDFVEQFRQSWAHLPRPWVIVNRKAGPWTPNKDWPDEYWVALVARLAKWSTLIEIGAPASTTANDDIAVDLRGRTTLPELAAAIAAADIHVGPDSGPMHIAAAAGKPSVVIFGGYILPVNTSYTGNVDFYTPLKCSPCWLTTPCPFSKRCLTEIPWKKVEAAVRGLWAKGSVDVLRTGFSNTTPQ